MDPSLVDAFPYAPRPFQAEAAALVSATARDGGHLVLEAPTGTGKTVVLLSGVLSTALAAGRRVLYVTRTNSQQEQAIRELVAISAKMPRPIRAYALQGRHRLCLKLEDANDTDLEESTPEELSHFCRHAKRLAENDPQDAKGCRYWGGLLDLPDEDLEERHGPIPLTAEAFKALGRADGLCSYEATKRLLPKADVVVAPYVFAFDPGLRTHLFQWWTTDPAHTVLIVDEAHNLPSYLRELFSPRLGKEALRRALSESETLRHPIIGRDVSARTLLETLAESLDEIVQEYAPEEDGFVPPFELETRLLGRFHLTTQSLLQCTEHLVQLGEIIKDRRRLLGKVPKSSLATVGQFVRRWLESDEASHVKLAIRNPRPALEAFCVDAREPARVLSEFHATVHASGTLTPLQEYRDALGLGPDARLERFPSPFPPQRLTVVVTRGLTTRFESLQADPRLVDALQESTKAFVEACRVSAAVFFPSHRMLRDFVEVGVLSASRRQLLVESRELNQERLMQLVEAHRRAPGESLLAGVLGGRLSEGLDFPGRQLEALLLVGVPFPKPTARQRSLHRYYEAIGGHGWDYAYKAPALRRLRQAIGRLIRSADDRGFTAVLDERAAPLLESAGVAVELVEPEELPARFDAWQREAGNG